MCEEQRFFLSLCRQVPARLTVEQAAWLLNCTPDNISFLMRAGLLKPLGDPPQRAQKLFAADEMLELIKNRSWLVRVTNAIHKGHRMKNGTRKSAKRTGILPRDHSPASVTESSA